MKSHEVTTPSSTTGISLAGCLQLPVGEPAALVVLLSGSGPQDRDQTIAGIPTFALLRAALARAGYASYAWDDRGVGASEGDYRSSSSAQLVADAGVVIDHLRELAASARWSDGALDLIVAGHSQGTLIGALLARQRADIDALVLLAAAGRTGRGVLLEQHRRLCQAHGIPQEIAVELERMKATCFDHLIRFPETLGPAEHQILTESIREVVRGCAAIEADDVDAVVYDLLEWEWRFLLRHPTAATLGGVACPTLVVAGERDLHIHPAADTDAVRRSLEDGACPAVEAYRIPDLDHLFGRVTADGEPSGEPAAFDPSVIEPVVSWLDRRAERPRTLG